jgi:hypothetical protein
MFLTPKPAFVPPPATKHRPYIGAIFGPNFVCMLLHIFTRLPSAGESTRGHMHGGIIIDFIGQKPPSSKVQLLAMDVLVAFLQCFMLAVHVEGERLKAVIAAPATSTMTEAATAATNPGQDIDAEERGLTRDAGMTAEDIEMQTLRPSTTEEVSHNEEEHHGLLEETSEETEGEGPLDVFYSGNAVISDFHLIHTLRTQWEHYDNTAGTENTIQSVGATAGYSLARMNLQLRRMQTLRS